jgi:hypothetical protein
MMVYTDYFKENQKIKRWHKSKKYLHLLQQHRNRQRMLDMLMSAPIIPEFNNTLMVLDSDIYMKRRSCQKNKQFSVFMDIRPYLDYYYMLVPDSNLCNMLHFETTMFHSSKFISGYKMFNLLNWLVEKYHISFIDNMYVIRCNQYIRNVTSVPICTDKVFYTCCFQQLYILEDKYQKLCKKIFSKELAFERKQSVHIHIYRRTIKKKSPAIKFNPNPHLLYKIPPKLLACLSTVKNYVHQEAYFYDEIEMMAFDYLYENETQLITTTNPNIICVDGTELGHALNASVFSKTEYMKFIAQLLTIVTDPCLYQTISHRNTAEK